MAHRFGHDLPRAEVEASSSIQQIQKFKMLRHFLFVTICNIFDGEVFFGVQFIYLFLLFRNYYFNFFYFNVSRTSRMREGKIKFLEKRNGNNNKNMAKNFNIVRKRKSWRHVAIRNSSVLVIWRPIGHQNNSGAQHASKSASARKHRKFLDRSNGHLPYRKLKKKKKKQDTDCLLNFILLPIPVHGEKKNKFNRAHSCRWIRSFFACFESDTPRPNHFYA